MDLLEILYQSEIQNGCQYGLFNVDSDIKEFPCR
jgi:hypothetical protein